MLEQLQKLLRGENPDDPTPQLDYINLSAPDQAKLADRQRRIDELKLGMGDVYLLARPVERKDKNKHQ